MESESKPQSAVTWVIQNSQHKGSAYFVLVMLAQCIDSGNPCPSHKDLSDMTRLTKPTVQHALGELEKDGTITSIKNGGKEKRGGKTNCYAIAGYTPVAVPAEPDKVEHPPVPEPTVLKHPPVSYPIVSDTPRLHDTPLGETVPGQNAVTPAHVHGDAATHEKDLSGKEKEKKHPLPAKAGKENVGAKAPTPAGIEWSDLITAIGEVFKAFGPEALNYANMLTGHAKKGEWGQCAFEMPVSAAELRQWWHWYHFKFPTVDRVKEPQKVFSAITEWRNTVKSRPIAPVQGNAIPRMKPVMIDGQTGMHQTIPESELEKLRPSVWGPRR